MFPMMRRSRQQLSRQEAEEILRRNSSGVLALAGAEDYPYAVPMSYVLAEGKLYFHSASAGHKIEAIRRQDKASFCVVDADRPVPEEYTTYFRSAIVFGRIGLVTGEEEKQMALHALAAKYAPDRPEEEQQRAIRQDYDRVCILCLTIEHLTGKQAIELTKRAESASG